ncbi:MAG: TolC family protein [Salinivirgaceae bacterium]|jgi:cobalt-zinc-cadmium efflux system outer membrane protein|nr:TolC family protein [Salinivirgaceae bacterium]
MKTIIYIILTLIAVQTFAQQQLDSYLVTGAKNNPGLKAKFNEYLAALEKVPQVGALPDPTIAFGYFIQPVETRVGAQQAKISVAQMFPWFGTLNAKEDVVTEMAKAKYELFEEAKSKLFYDIKSTWYNLYFTSRALAITRDNVQILNTFRKLALVKIESGKASAVDELRVEMEILELENQLLQLLDKLQTQKIAFNNFINVEASDEIFIPEILETSDLSIDREALLDSIRLNNHQVLNLEFQEASYEYQQVAAKKMGNPNFTIGMDYTFIAESSNTMLAPGESGRDAIMFPKVGLSIPLYRKKYTSMVKEAVFMQEATLNKKVDKINVLESIYEKANADYKDAKRRIDLHNKQLELAKKSLRILESEYATDSKNFVEILRMERKALMHNLELEKSRTDMSASVAFIHYLMGK